MKRALCDVFFLLLPSFFVAFTVATESRPAELSETGYYRYPAIRGDTIVFTAEGDLWRVGIQGGVAQRMTSHLGEESAAAFSADGQWLAYSAEYEGAREVYLMPAGCGLPKRLTFEGESTLVAGWTPDGKVLYSTRHSSTLPDWQLATVDPKTGATALLPLSQASDGAFDPAGKTLYFTRQHFQGSSTKRYQGGTAQNLWKYTLGAAEAVPLTADFPGTSKGPMWWRDRIYFLSDRDGTMNVWSMDPEGRNLRQHTHQRGWDIKWASLSEGRVAYQVGADLRVYDIASEKDSVVPIRLASDFDQERERWVKKPMEFVTSAHLSPDGDRVVMTARGQVFVAPEGQGRFVQATREQRVRFRQARFLPDGKTLLALSDRTGELEFEKVPANGVGEPEPLTKDGKVFRMDALPSPDGKWVVYQDKNLELWLLNIETKKNQSIATSKVEEFADFRWSPDSQWLAYVALADNLYSRIRIYNVKDGTTTDLTSDRVNSSSPFWSPDGRWIYFLSERHIQSVVPSPWGPRAPEPFYNEAVKLYLVSLVKDGRSPFEPKDELHPVEKQKDKNKEKNTDKDEDKEKKKEKEKDTEMTQGPGSAPAAGPAQAGSDTEGPDKTSGKISETNKAVVVKIDWEGIQSRVFEVPVPPGNYHELTLNDKHLYWLERGLGREAKPKLKTVETTNDDPKVKTLAEDIKRYELSADGKKLLIVKGDDFYIVSAGGEVKLEKSVDLKNWTFPLKPRDEWRQMFVESWRLMRDYFYDRNMHGVDWPGIRDKYLPLASRVTDRAELSDLIADMVGELSALHIFVTGGDFREGLDPVKPAGLGAVLVRDEVQCGYRIERIYKSDPDYPETCSPLARPTVDVREGAVILSINGVPALSAPDASALLRNQAGRQVLLSVKPGETNTPKDVVVVPLTVEKEADLRYSDWEYSRRLKVEEWGKGEIGYVHLRAMGANDIAAWAKNFYPVFNRKGLIVDVRHNRGGNIDSWILEKLLRKAWFYWQPRVGSPIWNMQYAFRGHVVALCDEHTASDGEAFSEGFKRLSLGKVIGTRTWGGEIWLSFDNVLVDRGIASAAETGVYGPEGKWLIEGHGVDPDIVVDNLPHATFMGEDGQLKAAVEYLREQIRLNPVTVPPPPNCPVKVEK
jgi:tricorn protease